MRWYDGLVVLIVILVASAALTTYAIIKCPGHTELIAPGRVPIITCVK
jgi:hypothetical protein